MSHQSSAIDLIGWEINQSREIEREREYISSNTQCLSAVEYTENMTQKYTTMKNSQHNVTSWRQAGGQTGIPATCLSFSRCCLLVSKKKRFSEIKLYFFSLFLLISSVSALSVLVRDAMGGLVCNHPTWSVCPVDNIRVIPVCRWSGRCRSLGAAKRTGYCMWWQHLCRRSWFACTSVDIASSITAATTANDTSWLLAWFPNRRSTACGSRGCWPWGRLLLPGSPQMPAWHPMRCRTIRVGDRRCWPSRYLVSHRLILTLFPLRDFVQVSNCLTPCPEHAVVLAVVKILLKVQRMPLCLRGLDSTTFLTQGAWVWTQTLQALTTKWNVFGLGCLPCWWHSHFPNTVSYSLSDNLHEICFSLRCAAKE